jgi:PadR family transcriptional regulator PadR
MEDKAMLRWEIQVKKGILDFIILLLLKEEQKYGYELLEYIKQRTGYDMAEGTIYPLLNRLKDDGLIDAKWVEMETGMPRKYYTLTPVGLAAQEAMKGFWTSLVTNLNNLL